MWPRKTGIQGNQPETIESCPSKDIPTYPKQNKTKPASDLPTPIRLRNDTIRYSLLPKRNEPNQSDPSLAKEGPKGSPTSDPTAKPNNTVECMLWRIYGHFAGTPFIEPRLATSEATPEARRLFREDPVTRRPKLEGSKRKTRGRGQAVYFAISQYVLIHVIVVR